MEIEFRLIGVCQDTIDQSPALYLVMFLITPSSGFNSDLNLNAQRWFLVVAAWLCWGLFIEKGK